MLDERQTDDLVMVPVYWVWIILGAVAVLLVTMLFYRRQSAEVSADLVVSDQEETVATGRRASLVLPAGAASDNATLISTASSSANPAPASAVSRRSSLVLPTP